MFIGMSEMIRNMTGRQTMNPLAQTLARKPRFRPDYVLTRGVWHYVGFKDPRGFYNARYQRRHPAKRHKPAKPWMK
jgi:hypothetical protein